MSSEWNGFFTSYVSRLQRIILRLKHNFERTYPRRGGDNAVHGLRYIFWAEHLGTVKVAVGRYHCCVDIARANIRHFDAIFMHFVKYRLGKSTNSELRGGIRCFASLASRSSKRTHVNNGTLSPFDHTWKHEFAEHHR